ncbi:MAG: creatininase family protein [Clostridia bacterium]|nr:creatininase family protein [Clostridia bacterium]
MAGVYYLAKLTYEEIDRLPRDETVIMLPMGPLEAHGPHLPLGVDFDGAVVLCDLAAELIAQRGINVAIAPAVPYALADVAMPFAGTVTLARETVTSLVLDIARSFARHGFKKMVVNCHHLEVPNLAALRAAAEAAREFGISVLVSRAIISSLPKIGSLLKGEHPELDIHAGETETAFYLWKFPEMVRSNFRELPPVWIDIRRKFQEGAKDFKAAGATRGYLGDPAKASAELGARLYRIQAEALADEVEKWLAASFGTGEGAV